MTNSIVMLAAGCVLVFIACLGLREEKDQPPSPLTVALFLCGGIILIALSTK